jgi:ubiquinone biosynthesis protein
MGQLDFADRLFLARLLDAILKRNYDEVARLHYDAGMLDDSVSLAAFSQSLRAVADPVLGKALGDISLGLVLGQILQISARFEISVQPQFNLLQKTMMMAEGVARSLNPSADMWAFARPLASDWISSEDNIRAQIDRVLSDFRQLYLKLPQILEKLDTAPPPPPPAPRWPYLIAAISVLIALYSTLPVH